MNEKLYDPLEEEKNELKNTLKLFNRLAVLAHNFFDKSPTQRAREAAGLAISPSMLSLCRSFFGNGVITEKELYILDAYAGAISSSPAHYSVGTLLVNEPYIAETYGDMMKKYAALYPEYDRPCHIEKMLGLGGAAVSAGLPRQFLSTDIRVASGKNDPRSRIKRFLSGLEDVESFDGLTVCRRVDSLKFREKINSSLRAAIIYSHLNDDSLLDFCRSAKKLNSYKITVGAPYEIFLEALYSFTGIQINAASLPVPQGAELLPSEYRSIISVRTSFFTENVFGGCAIFAVGKAKKIQKLITEAKKKGLQISEALQPQNLRLFSVTAPYSPTLKFKTDLLKMMYHMTSESAVIPKHSPEVLTQRGYGVEKVYENDHRSDAVYTVSLDLSSSPAPFNETILAASELVISAVKDGYSMKNGCLTLSASATLPLSSPEDLGHSLSVILGVYRAVTELGIPMESTAVETSAKESKIVLSLRAFSPKGASDPATAIPVNSLIYDSIGENSLPNFEILSKFCREECFPVVE